MEKEAIFIPHNVPSLKNSKTATTVGKGKNKRSTLVHSPAVRKYLQKIGVKKYSTRSGVENYVNRPNLFRDSIGGYFHGVPVPVIVKFHFIRDSKRKFDFHNAVQIIADLLVAHGFIEDDNMDYFIPVPMRSNGQWYSVDPKNPGVYLKKVEV